MSDDPLLYILLACLVGIMALCAYAVRKEEDKKNPWDRKK